MAMKIKQLMSSMLLIFCVWTCDLHLSVGQPVNGTIVIRWPQCGNSQYRNGSLFQLHLNEVLESLVANVSTSGFNICSKGQSSNSSVYGLVQCRGDLDSSNCQQCASKAKSILVEKCQNSTSGFMQFDGCFLRYDYHYFYNYSESSPIIYNASACDGPVSNQPEAFALAVLNVLSNITQTAVESPNLFSAIIFDEGSSPSRLVYSLAQCWRDLSQTSCQSCLSAALSYMNTCATAGGSGAQFHTMGCDLRYEIYKFFNDPILSPPTPLSERKKRNVLAITMGVVAAVVGLIGGIGLFRFHPKPWERISRTKGEAGQISLSPPIANLELIFKYDTLREATSHFKAENKLGEGGFGSVFKGVLPDGTEVAVKRLNIGSRQGDNEFLNEANIITRVQHRNLVKLLGCSVERSERLLVYEYLQNSSLDKIIFDTTKRHLLNWTDRYEIIVGTARGLAYLHEESEFRIIHRDIKASNILLDNKYRPKIADFGLAKFFAEDETHVSTRVAGTLGYMAPESLRGQLTEKADVFSFGVLALEIISGRKNQSLPQHMEFLIEATWRLYNAERALEVMDPTLEGSYSREEGIRVIKIGLQCTQAGAALRPSMSQVVSMLTSEQDYIPSPTTPAFVDLDGLLVAPNQVERAGVTPRRDPDNTSSTTPTVHSAAANPSSTILELR